MRLLQDSARAQGDTLFLGIAQVQEALLIGTGADLFGDLVYTQALQQTRIAVDELSRMAVDLRGTVGRFTY